MEQKELHLVKLMVGKSDPEGNGRWLPLWMHARDTADILCYLVQNWIPQAVRNEIGLQEEELVHTARFLGLVHDLGKATAVFQSRILLHIPEVYERLDRVLPLPMQFFDASRTPHARASEENHRRTKTRISFVINWNFIRKIIGGRDRRLYGK